MKFEYAVCVCFLLASFLIMPVYASSEDINLQNVPVFLGERLGIPAFAAGFLAWALIAMVFFLPILVLGKASSTILFIVAMILLSLGVALTWLPIWTFALIVLGIAFGVAKKAKGLIG